MALKGKPRSPGPCLQTLPPTIAVPVCSRVLLRVTYADCRAGIAENDSDSDDSDKERRATYKAGASFGYAARCLAMQTEQRKVAMAITRDPTCATFRKANPWELMTNWYCLYCTDADDSTGSVC